MVMKMLAADRMVGELFIRITHEVKAKLLRTALHLRLIASSGVSMLQCILHADDQ